MDLDERTTYDAYVEVAPDGSALAQLVDLPGCFAYGSSEPDAVERLTAAIPGYHAWLRQHDEYMPIISGAFSVVVRDSQRIGSLDGNPPGVFFEPGYRPITEEDLDWYLSVLDWAYADLFALIEHTDDAALDRPGSGGQSYRAIVTHMLRTQLWLVSRIEQQPVVPDFEQLPGTLQQRFQQVRKASIARFRIATPEECERITEHEGERWTLRKVLRRSILHVREHLATLAAAPV
jgi:predicted RNase H-like HicB family nuclease